MDWLVGFELCESVCVNASSFMDKTYNKPLRVIRVNEEGEF